MKPVFVRWRRWRAVILACVAAVALAAPACDDGEADEAEPAEDAGEARLDLVAEDTAFDRRSLTAAAGATVRLRLRNEDREPHNVSVYREGRAEPPRAEGLVYFGGIVPEGAAGTYEFEAPDEPGTYFFRCDIHPARMTGELVFR